MWMKILIRLDFGLGNSAEQFDFSGPLLILEKSWKKLIRSEEFHALVTAVVIKDPVRQSFTVNALVFVSYCQNPEIFICLCSVNYHPLIIYSNLYQFYLLIEMRKRFLLCCAFSQVEQGRIKRGNYFWSSQRLNETWKECKKGKK